MGWGGVGWGTKGVPSSPLQYVTPWPHGQVDTEVPQVRGGYGFSPQV